MYTHQLSPAAPPPTQEQLHHIVEPCPSAPPPQTQTGQPDPNEQYANLEPPAYASRAEK